MTAPLDTGSSHQAKTSTGDPSRTRRVVEWLVNRSIFVRALLLLFAVFPPVAFFFLYGKTDPVSVGKAIEHALACGVVLYALLAIIGTKILDYWSLGLALNTPESPEHLAFLVNERKEVWRKPRTIAIYGSLSMIGVFLLFGLAVLAWETCGKSAEDLARSGYAKVVQPFDEYTCKKNLQADFDELLGPAKDPTVIKCTGRPVEATCLVKSLHDGIYKTLPFVVNCSKRHLEDGSQKKGMESESGRKRWEAQLEEFGRNIKQAN